MNLFFGRRWIFVVLEVVVMMDFFVLFRFVIWVYFNCFLGVVCMGFGLGVIEVMFC